MEADDISAQNEQVDVANSVGRSVGKAFRFVQ